MLAERKEMRILIIEDEQKIADLLKAYLEKEGYTVVYASTGESGLSLLKDSINLVILDLKLPDIDGEDICKLIRENSDVPIIMLTARSAEEDKIRGLNIGADDYVIKPFSPREVVARVSALLRRITNNKHRYSFNDRALVIDFDAGEVMVNGENALLTPTEFKIIKHISSRPGQVFTRLQLVNTILGYDFEGYDRTIDAHIKNIRHKIDKKIAIKSFIKTVYGVGYKFNGQLDEPSGQL